MSADESLRELIRQEAQALSGDALANAGRVPAERLDELSRLSRLLELHEQAFPRKPSRWPLPALLLTTLTLASLLMFVHVGETVVQLDLTASEVSFRLRRPQVLTDSVRLREFSASGVSAVRWPEVAPAASLPQTRSGPSSLRISAASDANQAGSVTLAPLELPAGAEVLMGPSGSPNCTRLELNRGGLRGRVTVHGAVEFRTSDAATTSHDFKVPQSVLLDGAPAGLSLDLCLGAGATLELPRQVSIDKLTLSRVDEFDTEAGSTAQVVSTLTSGRMHFEALGNSIQLRPHELVSFERLHGVLQSLRLENGRLSLGFRGSARAIWSGGGDHRLNLMPTYLAWLRAQHNLSLMWASSLYAFGLLVAVRRWWRGQS